MGGGGKKSKSDGKNILMYYRVL